MPCICFRTPRGILELLLFQDQTEPRMVRRVGSQDGLVGRRLPPGFVLLSVPPNQLAEAFENPEWPEGQVEGGGSEPTDMIALPQPDSSEFSIFILVLQPSVQKHALVSNGYRLCIRLPE